MSGCLLPFNQLVIYPSLPPSLPPSLTSLTSLPPSLSCSGLYMSDLTFTDNGNPNFHSDGLVNFSKCRLIYNQVRDLVLRQDKPYNFEEVPALHEGITKFHFLDTDVLYDVSLQREPR